MRTTLTAMLLGALACPAMAIEPCLKNHYILDEPCAIRAVDAGIGGVTALAFDSSGVLHFSSVDIVLRVDAAGNLSRVAGTGRRGFSGDGGPALQAQFSFSAPKDWSDWIDFGSALIAGLAFDAAGNLYIADSYNNRIRVVDAGGTIRTFRGGEMKRPDDVGLQMFWPYWWPQGVAVDPSGGVYVSSPNASILRIPFADEAVEQIVDWPATDYPQNIAIDGDRGVYLADYCSVKRVSRDHAVAEIAGKCNSGWYSAYGLHGASAVAVDGEGSVYFAETFSQCIRKVSEGRVTTIAGVCDSSFPGGSFSGDNGPAVEARLNLPLGIALDGLGNIYIADTGNKRIRKIDANGIITTIAGNGEDLPR